MTRHGPISTCRWTTIRRNVKLRRRTIAVTKSDDETNFISVCCSTSCVLRRMYLYSTFLLTNVYHLVELMEAGRHDSSLSHDAYPPPQGSGLECFNRCNYIGPLLPPEYYKCNAAFERTICVMYDRLIKINLQSF